MALQTLRLCSVTAEVIYKYHAQFEAAEPGNGLFGWMPLGIKIGGTSLSSTGDFFCLEPIERYCQPNYRGPVGQRQELSIDSDFGQFLT